MTRPPVLGGTRLPAPLAASVRGAAGELAARGVHVGSRVAVAAADPLPWLLGADLLGAATLVLEPSWTPIETEAVLADARPDTVVDGVPAPSAVEVEPYGNGDTAFYLPTTSGSSGRPKVLQRTRASWLRSFAALPLPGDGPVLVPGPLSSSLFLFAALHALHAGRRPVLMHRWHAPTAAEHATSCTVVHVVPAMLAALLDVLVQRPELRAACTLRTVVCGGAAIGDPLRARLRELLPACELVEYYGSAEHSLIAIRRGDDTALRPVEGVDVEVRDGVLFVRSPLAFSGYLRAGELQPAPAGWSTVDDTATLHTGGTLTLHGRGGSGVVESGGKLVAVEEVEAALRAVPGVRDVVVAGTPHAVFGALVTAVVEPDPAAPPALPALRDAARARLEPAKRPRRWLTVEELPRTPAGKPARAAIASQLSAGALDAATLQ
ncbi:class I adenylate-forming enzyme family protein [Pseudonocardia sp. TRM90224]|uniref:class I adenylate-forming enzyme family protein n=1 Tax=Pseudonocardia sp. TRM90224 TaxID=2812678 RepID=UPI001E3921A2|nr:AMP-binding protein [Pseudonocardia sp. TRM90224]